MLEPREKTSRLSSDDGHRDSSSQMVKKQTLFRRRHRPALQQGNVLGFGDCQLLVILNTTQDNFKIKPNN